MAITDEDISHLLDSDFDGDLTFKFLQKWRKYLHLCASQRNKNVKGIHFRRMRQIQCAFITFQGCTRHLADLRSREEGAARRAQRLRKNLLSKRGFLCFVQLLQRDKRSIAQKWFDRQLLVSTFGAWVRVVSDREEESRMCRKGDTYFIRRKKRYALNEFGAYLANIHEIGYQNRMAETLRCLLLFKKSVHRWRGFLISRRVRTPLRRKLQAFVIQKQIMLVNNHFKMLRDRTRRRVFLSSRLLCRATSKGQEGRHYASAALHTLRNNKDAASTNASNKIHATNHYTYSLLLKGLGRFPIFVILSTPDFPLSSSTG